MFNDVCALLSFFPLVNTICCHGELMNWKYFGKLRSLMDDPLI